MENLIPLWTFIAGSILGFMAGLIIKSYRDRDSAEERKQAKIKRRLDEAETNKLASQANSLNKGYK